MFGLSFPELLIVLVVALIVLGPERLPKVARTIGKGMREIRKMSGDFKDVVEGEFYKLDEEIQAKPVLPGSGKDAAPVPGAVAAPPPGGGVTPAPVPAPGPDAVSVPGAVPVSGAVPAAITSGAPAVDVKEEAEAPASEGPVAR